MKTRQEVITQPYLNIRDIQILLKVSYGKAKKIYEEADGLQLKKFHDHKVSIKDVMKVTGINFSTLLKQIEYEKTA